MIIEKRKMPHEVQGIIEQLEVLVKDLFSDKLRGIYIHGSIATGHFNVDSSDIDFFVLLENRPSDADFMEIQRIHKKITERDPYWGVRLEGSYIGLEMLKSKEPPEIKRPYVNGGTAQWAIYGQEWIFEKSVLRELGITIVGESLSDLIQLVTKEEIRCASRRALMEWWLQVLEEETKLDEEYLVYGVLSMCRVIYSIQTGETKSKKECALWLMEKSDEERKRLIQAALEWKVGMEFGHETEVIGFIRETIQQYGNDY